MKSFVFFFWHYFQWKRLMILFIVPFICAIRPDHFNFSGIDIFQMSSLTWSAFDTLNIYAEINWNTKNKAAFWFWKKYKLSELFSILRYYLTQFENLFLDFSWFFYISCRVWRVSFKLTACSSIILLFFATNFLTFFSKSSINLEKLFLFTRS